MDYRNFDSGLTFRGEEPSIYNISRFGGGKFNVKANRTKNGELLAINSDAEVLFVSEISSEVSRCFSTDQTSRFFYDAVEKSGIKSYYVTPAIKKEIETEDEQHMLLRLEIEVMEPVLVVALGRKSEKMLLKVKDIYPGLRWFDVIPHPSFWLTFYANNEQEYVNLLKDIKRKVDYKRCL